MSYHINDPEDMVTCPYDDSHRVRQKRLPYHLMKCRKNYKGTDYEVCPFNAYHEMPKPELRHHIATCSHKKVLESGIIYEKELEMTGQSGFTPNLDWERPRCTEDWDNQAATVPRVGIDPETFNENITSTTLSGFTPAQKREFHERQRQNFLRKQQGLDPLPAAVPETTRNGQPKKEETVLRLPKNKPNVIQSLKPNENQQPSHVKPVFNYSVNVNQAGIGRGGAPCIPAADSYRGSSINGSMFSNISIEQRNRLMAKFGKPAAQEAILSRMPEPECQQFSDSEDDSSSTAGSQTTAISFPASRVLSETSSNSFMMALNRGRGMGRGVSS